jgi:hypothetical protein
VKAFNTILFTLGIVVSIPIAAVVLALHFIFGAVGYLCVLGQEHMTGPVMDGARRLRDR